MPNLSMPARTILADALAVYVVDGTDHVVELLGANGFATGHDDDAYAATQAAIAELDDIAHGMDEGVVVEAETLAQAIFAEAVLADVDMPKLLHALALHDVEALRTMHSALLG